MYEWQCESEWGWGIYVFSLAPPCGGVMACFDTCWEWNPTLSRVAEILAQLLHKSRPDIPFAQCLHKPTGLHRFCTYSSAESCP
jgi:hypothetical protein